MADRRGHRSRIVRAQPLGSQIGDLGHQNRKPGAREGPCEGHQARIVLAEPGRARHQHDGRRRAARPVQIAEQVAGAGPGHVQRRGSRAFNLLGWSPAAMSASTLMASSARGGEHAPTPSIVSAIRPAAAGQTDRPERAGLPAGGRRDLLQRNRDAAVAAPIEDVDRDVAAIAPEHDVEPAVADLELRITTWSRKSGRRGWRKRTRSPAGSKLRPRQACRRANGVALAQAWGEQATG